LLITQLQVATEEYHMSHFVGFEIRFHDHDSWSMDVACKYSDGIFR
jgi:hypothetical protein